MNMFYNYCHNIDGYYTRKKMLCYKLCEETKNLFWFNPFETIVLYDVKIPTSGLLNPISDSSYCQTKWPAVALFTTMAEGCSTEKEEQFLSVYFNCLAQSSFDKARDLVVSVQL